MGCDDDFKRRTNQIIKISFEIFLNKEDVNNE